MNNQILIIIPTYRHLDYADRCVESLIRTTPTYLYKTLIIDDNSPEWMDYQWKMPSDYKVHFNKQGGLTRSWNEGLKMARDLNIEYAICTNSDILFSNGWYISLLSALKDYDLVGPVSNAPGHCKYQDVNNFLDNLVISDQFDNINTIASSLKLYKPIETNRINGFFMMAKTDTWWNIQYDDKNVFNPIYKLTGNEDELQKRWVYRGMRIAYVPNSYIFHYRSISRPINLNNRSNKGAYRG